jgi:hypothetical protein
VFAIQLFIPPNALRRISVLWIFFLVLLSPPQLVHAQEPLPQHAPSARAMALQGGLAAPSDNAALFLNPAGAGIRPRYEISLATHLVRDGAPPDRGFNLSILDSKTTGEIGGGVAWRRDTGGRLPADDFVFALAQKYGFGSAFGVAFHYRIDRERARRSDMNLDSGMVIDQLGGLLKIGAVVKNIFNPPEGAENVNRLFGLGLGSRFADLIELTVDATYTPELPEGNRFAWNTGLEGWIGSVVALRGGYGQSPMGANRQSRWSLGAGFGQPGDFQAGYAFVSEIERSQITHALDLSVFLF